MTWFDKLLLLTEWRPKPAPSPRIQKLEPLVFRDPTDDGSEVAILRGDKVIVRKGDDFILGYPLVQKEGKRRRWYC